MTLGGYHRDRPAVAADRTQPIDSTNHGRHHRGGSPGTALREVRDELKEGEQILVKQVGRAPGLSLLACQSRLRAGRAPAGSILVAYLSCES